MPDLIIARYNEDIDWLTQVPPDYTIFLYNKGRALAPSPALERVTHYVRLPNTGREGDTYLHHMLYNMGKADSFSVFTQANPFEHAPDFLALLSERFSDPVWGYSCKWKDNFPPQHLLDRHRNALGTVIRNELFSLYNWEPLFSHDLGAALVAKNYSSDYDVPNGINIAANFFGHIGHNALQEAAQASMFGEFSYGGLFGVRNECIHQMDKAVFFNTIREIRTFEVVGYVLERLWLHFFGKPFLKIDNIPYP